MDLKTESQGGIKEEAADNFVAYLNPDALKREFIHEGISECSFKNCKTEEDLEKIKVEPDVCDSNYFLNEDFEEVKAETIPSPLKCEEEFNVNTEAKKVIEQDQPSSSEKEFSDQGPEKRLSVSSDNKIQGNSTEYVEGISCDVGQSIINNCSGAKNFKCNECGKYSLKSYLNRSRILNSRTKPFKCNICIQSFNRYSSLKKHINIHTDNKSFTCSECGKCFTWQVDLKKHMYIYTDYKPFECNECGKCFTRRDSLKQHCYLHTGNKRFKCNECGKFFTRREGLKQHIFMHTGSKPFKCNECGKCFTRRESLKQHIFMHTGSKPFKCNECGKCFSRREGLKQHIYMHTGNKRFKCKDCDKSFIQRRDFMNHMDNHITNESFK